MKDFNDIIPTLAILGAFAGLLYMFIIGLQQQDNLTPEQIEKRSIHNTCISKVRGSKPACWTETDWKAYCSRVQCK
jgi:hypothetical protein